MKKALLLLLMLPAMLLAAPVDPNVAQQVAENFINAPETDASGIVRKAPHKRKCMARAPKQITNDQQFYIFNSEDGEGFVIVSADDRVRPIIGYSDKGNIDCNSLPQGVAWWLSEYSRQIESAIRNNVLPSDEITNEWEALRSKSYLSATDVVSPLVSTTWNQAPYYNVKCPYNGLTHSYTLTGCAATALAQVMKYWEWPIVGNGHYSYNTFWYGTQSANFGATYYDWANMPNEVVATSTATQMYAVATLMYHCGVAMDMDYGYDGSGIKNASQIANAVKNYFRYSSSTKVADKSNYSESNWISLLKSQLDASQPMVYCGSGSGGGHAFVCDGYRSDNYFHFNWGWGGTADGWYPVSDLAPGPNGYGSGTSGNYTTYQWAVIDMVPQTGSTSAVNLQLSSKWVLSSDSIPYGGALAGSVSIKNIGTSSFTGDIVAVILDKDGNFFADYTIQQNCTIAKNGTLTVTPSVAGNAALVPGRYYVALFSRSNAQGYQIIGSDYFTNIVTFKVYYQAEIETYSDFAIYSDDNNQLVTGHQSQICLTLKNTGSTNFRGTVALALYTSDLSTGQDYDEISLSLTGIAAGATRTLTFSGTITLDPGTYIIALVYRDNNGNFNFAGSTYYSNPVYVVVKGEGEGDMPTDPITVKAKMPSNWGSTISAWAWLDGSEGQWVTLKRDGEWYSYTTSAIPLNIIFVNGSTWNGDNNQTVDIRLTENTCIQLNSNGTNKCTYTVVDCPSAEEITPPALDCKSIPFTETFASSQGDFTIQNVILPDGLTSIWNWNAQYGMVAKAINGSTKNKSEAWLISPCIELPEEQNCVLTFSHAAKFFSDTDQMTLYLTTNYITEAPGESNWEQLIIPTYPTGTNWNWFESGEIDLSAYKGENIVVGFRYVSNTNYAPQWEIKNFAITQSGTSPVTPPVETNRYIVLAQRDASSNWFYMTSDLGSASTKRYQAVDAGTNVLANVSNINLEDKYYWEIEENKLKTAAGYSTWSSGNSANLDATGKELTIQQQADGTYTFSFADGSDTRYLSLNKTTGNDYFAYYKGIAQVYKLTLVKEGATTPTAIENTSDESFHDSPIRKVIEDGQLYIILPNGTRYTATGVKVE